MSTEALNAAAREQRSNDRRRAEVRSVRAERVAQAAHGEVLEAWQTVETEIQLVEATPNPRAQEKPLRAIAQELQRLLVALSKSEACGDHDAALVPLLVAGVDRFLAVSPEWVSLLRNRARLLEVVGLWKPALLDLHFLTDARRADSTDRTAAAGLLLTLGEYGAARRLLRDVLDSPGTNVGPSEVLDSADRLEAYVRAHELLAWMDDYEGKYPQAMARLECLLGTPDNPGPALRTGPRIVGGVTHRMGRAMVEEGNRRADASLTGADLRFLKQAKRRAGAEANEFYDLWIARASLASRAPDRIRMQAAAWEKVEALKSTASAHLRLVEGRALLAEELTVKAASKFEESLAVWDAVHYVKGAFDASLELARCHRLLSGRESPRTAYFLELCRELGPRISHPALSVVEATIGNLRQQPGFEATFRDAQSRVMEERSGLLQRQDVA